MAGPRVIHAAGGIVWRPRRAGRASAGGNDRIEVLVVHRPSYDDWSFPKGKPDRGESLPVTAVREIDDSSVELILQMGTNLAFGSVAAEAGRWLGKPVLAVNTCTYWQALRSSGIEDRIDGFGSLLMEH